MVRIRFKMRILLRANYVLSILVVTAALLLSVSDSCSFMCQTPGESVAGPRLYYPITKEIHLSHNGVLEFKWERGHFVQTDHYVFKLYKGYNTTASNLIFTRKLSVNDYPLGLPAWQFRDGQIYTWVLIQVFTSGTKSDKSLACFNVKMH